MPGITDEIPFPQQRRPYKLPFSAYKVVEDHCRVEDIKGYLIAAAYNMQQVIDILQADSPTNLFRESNPHVAAMIDYIEIKKRELEAIIEMVEVM